MPTEGAGHLGVLVVVVGGVGRGGRGGQPSQALVVNKAFIPCLAKRPRDCPTALTATGPDPVLPPPLTSSTRPIRVAGRELRRARVGPAPVAPSESLAQRMGPGLA